MYKYGINCIETPAILKSLKRSSDSPRSKNHPPPSKSSYLQNLLQPINSAIEGHQIVIYGFEEKSKDLVLQKFHKIGPIEDIKVNPGNSISIKYRDAANAYKAADLHGHVIIENTMIGVKLIASAEKKQTSAYSTYSESLPYSSGYLQKKKTKKDSILYKIWIYVFNFDDF